MMRFVLAPKSMEGMKEISSNHEVKNQAENPPTLQKNGAISHFSPLFSKI
jgi:hypothetical protein